MVRRHRRQTKRGPKVFNKARTPIEWLEQTVPHAQALGQMATAAIGCVTPLRDGLNLVAKRDFINADTDCNK